MFVPGLAPNEAMRGKHWLPKLQCPVVTSPSHHVLVPQKRMGVGVITHPFSEVGP